MATNYKSSSVYRNTLINEKYLETYEPPIEVDLTATRKIEVESRYKHRPDLLAHDLYGDSDLWWVFALYNRNIIVDSIYDLVPGIHIRVPLNSSSIGV